MNVKDKVPNYDEIVQRLLTDLNLKSGANELVAPILDFKKHERRIRTRDPRLGKAILHH